MNIEEILSMMDAVLDKAVPVPFSGKKSLIDVEAMNNLIYEIRVNLPREIVQARGVVSERKQLINDASKEAEKILKTAEDRAQQMISNQEIVRMARTKAEEILVNAQQKSKELHNTTKDYLEKMLSESEAMCRKNLEEVVKARSALKNPGR